jgi:hypothetical protein
VAFLGVGQGFGADLGSAGGDDGKVRQRFQPDLAHCLPEEEQAPEALLQVALEEAGAGAEADVLRDQPEMGDPGGVEVALRKVGEKGIIALAPVFGGKGIGVVRGPGEGVSGVDGDHPVARRAQALDGGAGKTRLIGEDQPGEGRPEFGFHVHRAIGGHDAPADLVAEVADGLVPFRGHVGFGHELRLAGFDKVATALEGVGRQGDAPALRFAPELGQVGLRPAGPEAAKGGDEMAVV